MNIHCIVSHFTVAHTEKLEKKIIKYLNIVCEYEIVGLGGKEAPLASALSVLNILLMSQSVDKLAHLCKSKKKLYSYSKFYSKIKIIMKNNIQKIINITIFENIRTCIFRFYIIK